MAQPWYQKATVQAAIILGGCGVIAALIGVIALFVARPSSTPDPGADAPLLNPPEVIGTEAPPREDAWASRRFVLTREHGGSLRTCGEGRCVDLQVDPIDESTEPVGIVVRLLKVDPPPKAFPQFGSLHLGRIGLIPGALGFVRFEELDIEATVREVHFESIVLDVDLLPGSLAPEPEGGSRRLFQFGVETPPE